MKYALVPHPIPVVPVRGNDELFPVHRIYCVGKNYAAHVREMGGEPERQPPCFFMKPADAVVTGDHVPYPSETSDYHYEGELVVAIGKAGSDIPMEQALEHIFGYAVGLDMTRRDLQTASGRKGQPWDTGKGFDHSAPVSSIVSATESGHPSRGAIRLKLNGELRQQADIADMIWTIPEIISELSRYYSLQPGDLVFTGTPAGVGAVVPGDQIEVSVEGVGRLHVRIA